MVAPSVFDSVADIGCPPACSSWAKVGVASPSHKPGSLSAEVGSAFRRADFALPAVQALTDCELQPAPVSDGARIGNSPQRGMTTLAIGGSFGSLG